MNNKLLLLNLKEVEQIVLLDEACDPPSFANWDSAISEGEIPLAVYEALEDYDPNWEEDEISPKMGSMLEKLLQEKGWDEMDVIRILKGIKICFRGNQETSVISSGHYDEFQTLTDVIQEIYEFGEHFHEDEVIRFEDWGEAEILFKLSSIAMMEMPLIEIENAICQQQEELLEKL